MRGQAPEYGGLESGTDFVARALGRGERGRRFISLLDSAANEARAIAQELEQEATTLRKQRIANKAVTR